MADITRHFHGGADTSRQAFQSIKESRLTVAEKVLNYIKGCHGASCEQVERALKLSHQCASARIAELSAAALIYDTGKRIKTASGRTARFYRAADGKRQITLI